MRVDLLVAVVQDEPYIEVTLRQEPEVGVSQQAKAVKKVQAALIPPPPRKTLQQLLQMLGELNASVAWSPDAAEERTRLDHR